jgi:serine/threonine protein kinase
VEVSRPDDFCDRVTGRMSLNPGSKLGPYEILEPIGKGGMGEVYRARDPRMGREVAIKISAEAFSDRFSREVHAVAALSHPNVCTLHDVGPDYLVMEMVEGPTLAERIKQGTIPFDEALAIARQIALALEAAHEKNIVHRDLKPANIKLKPDGTVKVLDFGLAMVDTAQSRAIENSPTFATYATQPGMIVGTAAYMAPEQARGKAVDKRVDIWSFGVVLAEMVSGKSPFQGEDVTEMLASVVKTEPELHEVPPQLKRLIRKCLEKDPKKRLRDIGDVWDLLHEPPKETKAATPSVLPWAIAGVLLLAAAALAVLHFRETVPEPRAVEFIMDPPAETVLSNYYAGYAPSPDGRYIVYTAGGASNTTASLWLRSLDSATARMLPGTENSNAPFWSPDSKSIVFYSNGKLRRVEISGGTPLTLCDAVMDPVTTVGTWNRDGLILFGSSKGLQQISVSNSSSPTPLTTVNTQAKETGHGYPQFLPDGQRFLFFVASSEPNVQGMYISSLKDPSKRDLVVRTAAKAVYVPPRDTFPGYLLWMQEQSLVAQRFDVDSLQREGEPVLISAEVGLNPNLAIRASFWASDAGLLAYFKGPERDKRPIGIFSREGKQLLESPPDVVLDVDLSPDGSRMVVAREENVSGGAANRDIWIRDLTRGVMTRLTFNSGFDGLPVWSPDGKWIAYASERADGIRQIYRKDASGAGQEELLSSGSSGKFLLDWSKDGKFILYREQNSGTGRDLMAFAVDGERKPFPVVQTPFQEFGGSISFDGKWVAYLSNDTGRNEVYVQSFPGADGPGGRWQISRDGAQDVRWRGDGKELYFQSLDGKIMAATLQTGPQGVVGETPRMLFPAKYRIGPLHEFDVSADGQKFVLIVDTRSDALANRLTVISNWQATVGKRGLR